MADDALKSPLREAVAAMNIHAPTERNPKLARFLEGERDMALKARWHVQQVTAERMDMNDHSWVHLQIVSTARCTCSGCCAERAWSPRSRATTPMTTATPRW